MARAVEYSKGGLTKRPYKGGWRWTGQVKWRHVGETKWRTKEKSLTDEDGNPIRAKPRRIDPETGRDGNTQNITKARAAYDRWLSTLDAASYDGSTCVREYLLAEIDRLKRQNEAAREKGQELPYAGSTLRGYSDYVPIVSEGFEGMALASVDSGDVFRWVEGMKDRGLAPATMRKAFSFLSVVCDKAVLRGDIASNPCTQEVRNQIPEAPTKEPNALSVNGISRVNRLLDEAKNPRLRIGARIALACGLRAGEVCGLRWRDVDVDEAGELVLRVSESIADVGGGNEAKTPKSYAGTRKVPIPRSLVLELTDWCRSQLTGWEGVWTVEDGTIDPSAVPFEDCRVVGYPDGTWFTPKALGHLWTKLAKGRHDRDPNDRRKRGEGWEKGREPIIGITGEAVTLHVLRHTFATYHVATGTNIVEVARLMGHADPAVTMRRYTGRKITKVPEIENMSAADVLTSGTSWRLVMPDYDPEAAAWAFAFEDAHRER